jgi:hypothetical protein
MHDDTRTGGRAARSLGALIFGIGLLMMVVVFALAAVVFAAVPETLAAAGRSSAQGIGPALAATAARSVLLLVMAYVSSLLASKGLDLYVAARPQSGG